MNGLLAFLLVGGYIWGIWKFASGYRNTNFSASLSNRISLSLLWPVLVLVNGSYRRNFVKALKG